MSLSIKLILASIVGVILFAAFDGPERTRKALDPIEYWTEKRDKSQEMVGFYRNEMRSCRLEFEKLKRTRYSTMRQAVIAGSTPQEARDEFVAKWEATKEACATMRELQSMEEADLERASQELARHQ